jgi:hypothetical protein
VFQRLHEVLVVQKDQDNEPPLPEAVAQIRGAAAELGAAVLAEATDAERIRFLAFAIAALLEDPMQPVHDGYQPAYASERGEFNAGRVLLDLALDVDPASKHEVTSETLVTYFEQTGWENPQISNGPALPWLARRLRRMQRRLGIQPPIFVVSEDDARIVTWQPHYTDVFGDVRPALRLLRAHHDEEADV